MCCENFGRKIKTRNFNRNDREIGFNHCLLHVISLELRKGHRNECKDIIQIITLACGSQ